MHRTKIPSPIFSLILAWPRKPVWLCLHRLNHGLTSVPLESGGIFFGNVDRRHAISIVNTTCDNLTKGAPLHVFFAVSTVAVFGTCYTLYSCHAIDSQLTVNTTVNTSTFPVNAQSKRTLRDKVCNFHSKTGVGASSVQTSVFPENLQEKCSC